MRAYRKPRCVGKWWRRSCWMRRHTNVALTLSPIATWTVIHCAGSCMKTVRHRWARLGSWGVTNRSAKSDKMRILVQVVAWKTFDSPVSTLLPELNGRGRRARISQITENSPFRNTAILEPSPKFACQAVFRPPPTPSNRKFSLKIHPTGHTQIHELLYNTA